MPKRGGKRSAAPNPGKSHRVQPLTSPSEPIRQAYPFLEDFFLFDWKHIPPRHAYGAYALSLFASLPDYIEAATDATTEGFDDKDIDLCLVDREAGRVYIAQCYVANEWDQPSAPTNKADDLLTGLSWLLNPTIDDIPEALRNKAREVQDALRTNEVAKLELLYIHNCRESGNVLSSLNTVASSAKTLIQNDSVGVAAKELGLPKLQHLYESLTKQIVVEDTVTFEATQQLHENGDGWEAVATTISGVALHDLWQRHRDDLFSANIRGFLDMLSRKTSINKGILETVQLEPTRFWAFNNGVTILTKRIVAKNGKLTAHGVSVINGAQTTGVLGNAPRESAAKVRVPCRFVQCSDKKLIDQIIDSNNTQNAIKSFDYRSNDKTQHLLRIQFLKYGLSYIHRRQGASRVPTGAIQAEVIAPHLAAFHGRFQIAVRQRRTIFEEHSVYGAIFPPEISAEHVYMVQALADAISRTKIEFHQRVESAAATGPESATAALLDYSTSKFFVAGVVGELAPLILGRPIPNLFDWSVSPVHVKQDRSDLTRRWKIVVDGLVPLIAGQTGDDVYETIRSGQRVVEVATQVGFVIQSLKRQYDDVMSPIRDVTELR